MKILIGAGIVLLIAIVLGLFIVSGARDTVDQVPSGSLDPVQDVTSAIGSSTGESPLTANDTNAGPIGGPADSESAGSVNDNGAEEESVEDALDRALQSMQESLSKQDARTPEMSKPYEREQPTEEELADPTLYQAYELRQTRKMAAVFAGVNKEIPVIQSKINAARLNGTQTEEEIQEAEEALLKMESLSEFLRLKFPDIAEESNSTISSLKQNYQADQ